MKKIIFTFAMIAFVSLTFAQKDQAHIIFDIKMESNEPEIQAQLGMLAGSTLELMFKGDQSRQAMAMGSMMNQVTIQDRESGEGLLLISGMMGKYAARMDTKKDEEKEEVESDTEVELVDETKEILGYTCHKAIIIDEDGNESVFWYTKELVRPETESQYFRNEIPGMPLEFSVVTPQMTMVFTAKEVNTKIKGAKKKFSMDIPEGYTETPIDQLQSLLGGGQ